MSPSSSTSFATIPSPMPPRRSTTPNISSTTSARSAISNSASPIRESCSSSRLPPSGTTASRICWKQSQTLAASWLITARVTSSRKMPSAQAGPQQPPEPKHWIVPTVDPSAVARLAEHLSCPNAIAGILLSRGISDAASAQAFLNPSIDDLHDPLLMLGMDLAVARIQQAVHSTEPILIYGDYYVYVTTATVLLKTAIQLITPKVTPLIL